MYSARSVGPVTSSRTLDEVVRRASPAGRYSRPPRSGTIEVAPGCRAGFEPAVTTYSTRTVECCFGDRRSDDQRLYGALLLSYGATVTCKLRRRDLHPQPPGLEPCTPSRQSVVFRAIDNRQRSGVRESLAFTAVRIGNALPTVDWQQSSRRDSCRRLLSRSPGFATLGPSCTPDRQLAGRSRCSLIHLLAERIAQRRIAETSCLAAHRNRVLM
jgi:hypothetical protein